MDKKEQIIQAAMRLLIAHGVQGTPMSAVAKEAGTGMGTIYNYFPTKEDLINAIYIHIKQQELRAVAAPFENDSIKKQFEHFYRTAIHHMISNPAHFWFMEQFSSSPIIKEETRLDGMKGFTDYYATLKRGQEQGIIKNMNPDDLVQFVHGGIKNFIRMILMSGQAVTQEMIQNQLRLAWDAIKE